MFGTEETDRNAFSVNIDIESGFVDGQIVGQFTIDYANNSYGYGLSPYGLFSYGDVIDPNRKVKIGPIKSKALRFVLKNDDMLENVDIAGWELEITTPYRQTIKE